MWYNALIQQFVELEVGAEVKDTLPALKELILWFILTITWKQKG